MNHPAVRLRIGAITLHGVPVASPHQLGPAVAAALCRLLADRGTPAGWSTGELATRPVTLMLDRTADPERLARQVAAALYEGLGG